MAEDGFKLLTDTRELGKVLDQLDGRVRARVAKKGLRQAGARTRTLLRRDAPRVSGNLRKSIGVRKRKNGTVVVGLTTRFYYETLDLSSKRGAPLRPWFEASVTRHSKTIGNLIVEKTKEALAYEAGRAYAWSKRTGIKR
jgi:hypothetical protein